MECIHYANQVKPKVFPDPQSLAPARDLNLRFNATQTKFPSRFHAAHLEALTENCNSNAKEKGY